MKFFLIAPLIISNSVSFGQGNYMKCGDQFTDLRDGQIYNTVTIGSQCWMQQNLNFGVSVQNLQQSDNTIIEKSCYLNQEKWCKLFGGLYTWDETMQYNFKPQGICPINWHVPSKADWQVLITFLGNEDAGQKLKASQSDSIYNWDGTNESGFTAFPSGAANHSYFKRIDQWALFWSSTPENTERAWFTQLDSYWYPEPPKYKTLYLGNYYLKSNGFSVRCIKDE